MQQTLKRTTHRQLRWDNIILLAMSIATIVMLVIAIASYNDVPTIVDSRPYQVQSGDTLWDIAQMSNGYGDMDIRNIVYDIQQLSNCTAIINSGDIIYIPTYAD